MMNSICSDMKFTYETQDDFSNGFLPTLDFQMRMYQDTDAGCQQIQYLFFKKPMSCKYSILQTSLLSDIIKSNTITQEVIRRLSNTSVNLDKSTKVKIIQNYIDELIHSGYCLEEIERAVTPGLVGFQRRVTRQSEGGDPIHRKGSVIKK